VDYSLTCYVLASIIFCMDNHLNRPTETKFSIKELELMCGAVLYRLVSFKQAVPPADPVDIADHQALYERLNGMSEV
jgi:hypothetical protein